MVFVGWMSHNAFALFQTCALASGLVLIGIAILFEARARRAANLIQLTQQHRDLWERMYVQPELARIIDPEADPRELPVTPHEQTFVVFIILHLSSTYYAMRSGFFRRPQGLRDDIVRFFSLPIPHAVWEKVKALQDVVFVEFVDGCFPTPDLGPDA